MRYKQKFILISAILFFTIIPFCNAVDPLINVTKPIDGQVFGIGNNIITWSPLENINHVKIELHKGYSRIKALDIWVDNTGEFVWVIDSSDIYEYGLDYRIKVLSSVDPNIYGWSDYFCINLYLLNINIIYIMVITILLILVTIIYYDKKTHNIQNWIAKIRKRLKDRK